MPDDGTTIDYLYDLLDRISVYNADYVSKTSVCINDMRSHLITTDDSSAKYTAIGGLHPAETLQGHRRSAMGMHIHPLYDRCLM